MHTQIGDFEEDFEEESIFLAKRSIFAYSMSRASWKLLIWLFIWYFRGPSTCILWPVRFFVTLWSATGSISWDLIISVPCQYWQIIWQLPSPNPLSSWMENHMKVFVQKKSWFFSAEKLCGRILCCWKWLGETESYFRTIGCRWTSWQPKDSREERRGIKINSHS